MNTTFRNIFKKIKTQAPKALILAACTAMLSCGSGKPGDVVDMPPLPPFESIYGFVSKIEKGDFFNESYRVKDLPLNIANRNETKWQFYAADPSNVVFNGTLHLFFTEVYLDTNPECSDAIDNDSDGTSTPYDPLDESKQPAGCYSEKDIQEDKNFIDVPQCSNAFDDDGDTLTDLNDPSCSGPLDVSEGTGPECDDGIDNDGDTFTDFPGDPECGDKADRSESNAIECADGIDNDNDGQIDLLDASCTDSADTSEYDSDSNADNDVILSTRIKFGLLQPASPYISTGPDGITQSGLGGDDVQLVNPNQACTLLFATRTLLIDPGPDNRLETNTAGDDMEVIYVIGTSTTIESNALDPTKCDPATCDDVQVILFGTSGASLTMGEPIILGGLNGVIETIINDPSITEEAIGIFDLSPAGVMDATGTLWSRNGCPESGLGENEVQGVLEPLGNEKNLLKALFAANIGIDTGKGEPGNVAILPGPNGKIDTGCVYDDVINAQFTVENEGEAPKPQVGAIFVGKDFWSKGKKEPIGNGLADSGLIGDDEQLVLAGKDVPGYAVLIRPGPDRILDTSVTDDELTTKAVNNGLTALSSLDIVLSPGRNGKFETCPAGDDVITTFVGNNNDCSGASKIIYPGPDGILQTTPAGNDEYCGASQTTICGGFDRNVTTLTSGDDEIISMGICAGQNGIADTVPFGDDIYAIGDPNEGNLLVDTGLGGDDIQVLSAGLTFGDAPMPVVSWGPDRVLQTAVVGDDTLGVYNFNFPMTLDVAPTALSVTTCDRTIATDFCDDVQIVAQGNAVFISMGPGLLLPVIWAGPDGVFDPTFTTIDPTEDVAIMELGDNNAGIIGALGVAWPVPLGNGLFESGLAGRGVLDPLFCDDPNFDNGTSIGAFPGVDPFTGHPSADQCFARVGKCPDDCQLIPAGSATDGTIAAIISGPNFVINTIPLDASVAALDYSQGVLSTDPPNSAVSGDDLIVIADGGNKIAETGLGGDDQQIITGGQGAPDKTAIVNIGMPDHSKRIFTTVVANNPDGTLSDDVLVLPSLSLLGGEFLDWDNLSTNPDPDGDENPDNLASVDDGEYFAVTDTNITADFLPSGRNPQSITVMKDPNNASLLIAYLSDGIDIYRLTSLDGATWAYSDLNGDTIPDLTPVLSPGIPNAYNAVVLSGVDGICETTAAVDDLQIIQPGFGKANVPAITSGKDKAFSTILGGDDKTIIGGIITTGLNGILESQVQGDDRNFITFGNGQPDSVCVAAGSDNERDTTDAEIGDTTCRDIISSGGSLPDDIICASDVDHDDPPDGIPDGVGDDRPPFWDTNENSHYSKTVIDGITKQEVVKFSYGDRLPGSDEPSVGVGGLGGFDGIALQDPDVFFIDGTYYLYYTAIGTLDSVDVRFNQDAVDGLGPVCPRDGLNQSSDYGVVSDTFTLVKSPIDNDPTLNLDNTSGIVIAPRIGVATSQDGINWTKKPSPAIDIGHICAKITDLSFMSDALGLDATGLKLDTLIGPTDFDYDGAFAPNVYAETAANGEPIFTVFYTGRSDSFNIMTPDPPVETFGGPNKSGRTQFQYQIGVARSTDGINFTKIDSQNPLFVKPMLAGLDPNFKIDDYAPNVQRRGEVYFMYHEEVGPSKNEHRIVLGKREGAIFGGACLSVSNMDNRAQQPIVAAVYLAMMGLPVVFIIWRKKVIRSKH